MSAIKPKTEEFEQTSGAYSRLCYFADACNKDVLSCSANLSGDDLFMLQQFTNPMFDLLSAGLCNPAAHFLDPARISDMVL